MADCSKDISVDEITPGLFVGNMNCVESEKALRQLKITAAVSVVSKHRRPFPQPRTAHGLMGRSQHPLEKLFDVEDRLVVFVDDTRSDNIFRYLEGACEFIDYQLHTASVRDRADFDTKVACDSDGRGSRPNSRKYTAKETGRVLVHCTLGISRSVTIAAAYIMWKWGICASQALQHMQKKRSMSSPNESFIDQLLVWEELSCNPWSSRWFHIRPRAYYDMVNRLESHKRVREVTKALERAAKENAPEERVPTKRGTRAHSMERNTIRYFTRARH